MYQKETLNWIDVQLGAAKQAGEYLLSITMSLQQHAMLKKGIIFG